MIIEPNISSFIIGITSSLLIFMITILIVYGKIIIEIYYYLNYYKARNNTFEKLCLENKLIGIYRKEPSFLAMVSPIYKYYHIILYNGKIEEYSDGLQELIFWHEYGHYIGINSEREVWDFSKDIIKRKYGALHLKSVLWERIYKTELDGIELEYILSI